jgi:hypothetical protein
MKKKSENTKTHGKGVFAVCLELAHGKGAFAVCRCLVHGKGGDN